MTEFCARVSYKFPENASHFFTEMRRQTHKIFSRKHLAYERKIGSFNGSVIGSIKTNFRHRMPHKSVYMRRGNEIKKTLKELHADKKNYCNCKKNIVYSNKQKGGRGGNSVYNEYNNKKIKEKADQKLAQIHDKNQK